jgi:hypothetical protein
VLLNIAAGFMPISKFVRFINSADDCTLMQCDIDCIQSWCSANFMKRKIAKESQHVARKMENQSCPKRKQTL